MLNFSIINRFKGCGHHLNADPRGGRLAIRADKIEGGRSPVLSLSRRRLRRAKNFHRFPSRKRKVAPRRAALRHRLSVAVSPLSFPDKRAGEEKCGVDTLTGGEVAWIWDATGSEFAEGVQDSPLWTASERGPRGVETKRHCVLPKGVGHRRVSVRRCAKQFLQS